MTAKAKATPGPLRAYRDQVQARLDAFEAMRPVLRWFVENARNMVAHPELYSAIDHHIKEGRAALALADGEGR
jgi:hypothetical protein